MLSSQDKPFNMTPLSINSLSQSTFDWIKMRKCVPSLTQSKGMWSEESDDRNGISFAAEREPIYLECV